MSSVQTNTPSTANLNRHSATLLLRPAHSAVLLGPGWAVLCGALTASSCRLDASLLELLLIVILTQVMWSSWRTQLVDIDWRQVIDRYPMPSQANARSLVPYLSPTSPLGRVLCLWHRIRRWIYTLPSDRRSAVIAIGLVPPLILTLSMLVSWQILALSLAAIALSLIEWRVSWHGKDHQALRAGIEIGLSWLAGHVLFAPLNPLSLTLACCYALAYQGMLSYQPNPSIRRQTHALILLQTGQLGALVSVMLFADPRSLWATLAIGLLLTPQMLLLNPHHNKMSNTYLHQAAPYLLLSMTIAAWVT